MPCNSRLMAIRSRLVPEDSLKSFEVYVSVCVVGWWGGGGGGGVGGIIKSRDIKIKLAKALCFE